MSDSTQFKRTDKAITNALISLLKVKPFEKITIQDILDEAPVTRSTFYKHFHDKYEIAEKMQNDFLSAQMTIREELLGNPTTYSTELQKIFLQNEEFMSALLKIHTEKVDLRQAIAGQLETYYKNSTDSPNLNVEAAVYAQALTAFQLANKKRFDFSFDYMNDVFISVMLKLLGITDTKETRNFLKKKIAAKPSFNR